MTDHADVSPQVHSLSPEIEETNANQARAAAPNASAWVSANAGTGKTYVLTRRVLRLLLNGTQPDRILCLTYTKAAAAEMSRRVFDELATWSVAPPGILDDVLEKLEGHAPNIEQLALAPTLFARAIETPGGLKVQTIHAFCERLLQRFPLEAGVTPDFSILADEEQKELLGQSIDFVLARATENPEGRLYDAMVSAVRYAADASFDQLLRTVLTRRAALMDLLKGNEGYDDPVDGLVARLRGDMGLAHEDTKESLAEALCAVLDDSFATHAADVLNEGGKTDAVRADVLRSYVLTDSVDERIECLKSAFLTADLKPRKSVITKKPSEAYPDVAARLLEIRDAVSEHVDQLGAMEVVDATGAIVRLADAIFQDYSEAKRRRAALDYDDLILKTIALLGSDRDAQWVLYKLDNGLEHILVDEAQDTSPVQWRIVARLAEEFFSGLGASGTVRTLFAVGDEKQSIYGFQGARPEMFAAMGTHFRKLAARVDHTLHRVPLTMSFRTVSPVLDAVDATFASDDVRKGLTFGDEDIKHAAYRAADPGLVELWATEKLDAPDDISAWRPLDEQGTSLPIERLARRIAETVRGWIDKGTQLQSTGLPITAGDILILVRRRFPVAPALIRALKGAGIAVAGADRIRITEQIGVMDMMALGDFVLLPDDDLALATILKSPLFGLDDAALFEVSHGRKGSLWQALLKSSNDNDNVSLVAAAATLTRWRSRADYVPPFEFFSSVLEHDGRREAMLRRLGPEAGDALDEFLSQAIQYDSANPSSLQGFLTFLRNADLQIKRDMDQGRDEVRIMTVHGAKGLEAPIVFLPDTCSVTSGGQGPTVVDLPHDDNRLYVGEPFIWSVKGTSGVRRVREAKDAVKYLDDQEYRRLLYVAMTRARDRLYISGFEGKNAPPSHCWYNLMANALKPQMTEMQDAEGRVFWRLSKQVPGDATAVGPGVVDLRKTVPRPDWMFQQAPAESVRTIPVTPSRITPTEDEIAEPADGDHVELVADASASPLQMSDQRRFQRGVLTHALLQHLPSLAPDVRRAAAERFVALRGPELPDRLKASVVDETMAIVEAKAYAPLFSASSQAEVAIAAEIVNPQPGGRPLFVTGTIDRLIVDHKVVHFVDYKTNRPPPNDVSNVIDAYVAQLAAYRLVLAQLFPNRALRASLLWTDGARIMTLPDQRLDAVEPLLWSSTLRLEGATTASYVRGE